MTAMHTSALAVRCAVCTREVPTKPFLLASGEVIGFSCGAECGALLWEADFLRKTGAPRDEQATTAWSIRRRAAEANGWPFAEKAPVSTVEAKLNQLIAANGWGEVARELE